MSPRFFQEKHVRTAFVALDTQKCQACWECLKVCKNQVIGRINLPWHKHIRFANGDACTGCMRCVKTCKSGALSPTNQQTET